MAGRIFIESRDARFLGLPVGAQHLYLVHRDTDGAEYVIRSGPEGWFPFGGDMEIEANVPIEDSADDRGNDSPAERSSTELVFAAGIDAAWALMVKYARKLDAVGYGYDLFEENSNAFVGAMIQAAGGDPDAMLPRGVDADEAVGHSSWDEIVDDVAPPADPIFRGTAGPDRLAGLQIGETIRALNGRDLVTAGRGDDRVEGGAGADRLLGGAGDDVLHGNGGPDTLAGGPGSNRLVGGLGADRFLFGSGVATDRIDGFQDGIDRLVVDAPGIDGIGELAVTAAGRSTRVAFADTVVLLRGVDRALVDADDFLFPGDALIA
jgi:Ca2+-binding RTX toxin-like protein